MHELYVRILEQTERIGITGKELGRLLGLKKSPLTDWKNEKSTPTLIQLVKMCDIFAVSPNYLLLGDKNSITPISSCTEGNNTRNVALIEKFNKLSTDEQDEIIDIIDLKLSRTVKRDAVSEILKTSKKA